MGMKGNSKNGNGKMGDFVRIEMRKEENREIVNRERILDRK